MSPVVLPRGVVDLAADQPPTDVRLIAPTATLVARDTMHPALVQLFVQAAQQVHGGAGWFQRKGDFPNAANAERPIAAEAQRYFRSGPPLLQRHLPFWLANLADIEQRVDVIRVPLSYADELYSLRSHIDLVRQRVG